MRILTQSAAAHVAILMVDSADHVTPKTGLTPTVTISKNGAAFGALDGSATVTERTLGWYDVYLTAADTDTLGDLVLHAAATGADPSDRLVVVDNTATAIKAKTDNLPAQPAAVGDAMTLTVAYDAAKSAASQTSVNAIPTTAAPTVQQIDTQLTSTHGSGSWAGDVTVDLAGLFDVQADEHTDSGSFGWLLNRLNLPSDTALVAPVPGAVSADCQIVYGYITGLDGQPLEGVSVQAIPSTAQAVGAHILAMLKLSDTTDSTGLFSLVLMKTAEVVIKVMGHGTYTITVDNDTVKNLADYINPPTTLYVG